MKETTKTTITYAREAKHELNKLMNGPLSEDEVAKIMEMSWKLTFAACYTAETKKAYEAAQDATIALMHAWQIVKKHLEDDKHISEKFTFDAFREEAIS